jgi:hypothetical protein
MMAVGSIMAGMMMLRKKAKEEEKEGGCDIHNIHKRNNERAGNCTRFFPSSVWSSTREERREAGHKADLKINNHNIEIPQPLKITGYHKALVTRCCCWAAGPSCDARSSAS